MDTFENIGRCLKVEYNNEYVSFNRAIYTLKENNIVFINSTNVIYFQ